MKCTHPNHIDGKSCEDYAVSCHKDCKCCNPVDKIERLADRILTRVFDDCTTRAGGTTKGLFSDIVKLISDTIVRIEKERDEALAALKAIEEYGTKEINAAVELRKQLADARFALRLCSINCEHLHHEKEHQHEFEMPCPVEVIVRKAAGLEDK